LLSACCQISGTSIYKFLGLIMKKRKFYENIKKSPSFY
jgi:hypothetical protein